MKKLLLVAAATAASLAALSAQAATVDIQATDSFVAWTAPVTGIYKIEAFGAQGGDGRNPTLAGAFGTGGIGGLGAEVVGQFSLNAGTILEIAVGRRGESVSDLPAGAYGGGGGGGGTFVSQQLAGSSILLLAAAGGGGAGNDMEGFPGRPGGAAPDGLSLQSAYNLGYNGQGAIGGDHADFSDALGPFAGGGGGGGYYTSGQEGGPINGVVGGYGGQSYFAGLGGGAPDYLLESGYGGFGGGGGGSIYGGGGGGGYSGGWGGETHEGYFNAGYFGFFGLGGGSFDGALDGVMVNDGVEHGDGIVQIEYADVMTGGGGGSVPEPASWALMILGFGGVGSVLRRRAAGAPADGLGRSAGPAAPPASGLRRRSGSA